MTKKFVTGVILGTLFGRTAIRTAAKVVPGSARQRIYHKSLERVSSIVAHFADGILGDVEKELYGEEPQTRRYR